MYINLKGCRGLTLIFSLYCKNFSDDGSEPWFTARPILGRPSHIPQVVRVQYCSLSWSSLRSFWSSVKPSLDSHENFLDHHLILKNIQNPSSAPGSRPSLRTAGNRRSSGRTLPEFSANLAPTAPVDRGAATPNKTANLFF